MEFILQKSAFLKSKAVCRRDIDDLSEHRILQAYDYNYKLLEPAF